VLTATRRRLLRPAALLTVVATAAVAVVVVAVLAAIGSHSSGKGATSPAQAGGPSLLQRVSHVDSAVFRAVGNGGVQNHLYALHGAPPLAGAQGKPQVLYVGADSCPYCAAQRWSLVVALSRFGSFNDLTLTASSPDDVFPNTATFSFAGARYTSPYLDFAGIETSDRSGRPLQSPSPAQQALLDAYDAPPYVPAAATGGIPWIDLGGRYAMLSSGFTPQVLAGLDWNGIAGKLTDPGSIVTKAIVGNADDITAGLCRVTGMQPADVCTTAPVATLVAQLP
jgi:hypothetical protein